VAKSLKTIVLSGEARQNIEIWWFSPKVSVCNKKARRWAGFLSLFLFYRIERNTMPKVTEFSPFEMRQLEDFFDERA
jgi:hypothetical protein